MELWPKPTKLVIKSSVKQFSAKRMVMCIHTPDFEATQNVYTPA